MEETKDYTSENPNLEPEDDDYELTHVDKLVGVFTEPATIFSKMANEPPKAVDWLIPLIILIIVMSLSTFIMMSNPKIKYDIQQKQMAKIEKSLQDAVTAGQLSQEQADQRLEMIRNSMDQQMGGAGLIIQIVGIVIVSFIMFFIISGYFFLTTKFGLKGDGTYSSAMVAFGLPYYTAIIQGIVMVILALAMDKLMTGTSVADLLGTEKNTIVGFLLGKLDIFSIWFYSLVSIGLAKMFKSDNLGKYFILVFGSWIGVTLLVYFLAKAVPFLSFLQM